MFDLCGISINTEILWTLTQPSYQFCQAFMIMYIIIKRDYSEFYDILENAESLRKKITRAY